MKNIIIFLIATLTDLTRKFTYLALGSILLLAFVLRMIALYSLDDIYLNYLLPDEQLYHDWAKSIINGEYNTNTVYEISPLPVYIMAFVYKLFSADTFYIRVLNILYGVATCFFIYKMGTQMGVKRLGLASCFVAAIYKPFIFYNIVVLKTSLSLLLFSIILYLSIFLVQRFSFRRFLLLGLVTGLMINVRGNVIFLPPIFLLAILYYSYKRKFSRDIIIKNIFALLLGLSISIMPFTVRNYIVGGEFAITVSHIGSNFYDTNKTQNDGPYYRPARFASSSPFFLDSHFTIEASRRVGRKLTPMEASSFWIHETLRQIAENPEIYTWKIIQKIGLLFHRSEADDHYNIEFMSREAIPFLRLPFPGFFLIIPFAMAGIIFNIIKSEKFFLIIAIMILYSVTLILFHATTRFRLPLLAGLIPFACLGFSQIKDFFVNAQTNKAVTGCAIMITFFIIVYLPIKGSDDETAYYGHHGLALAANNRTEEAIKFWEISAKMNKTYSASSNLNLAKYYHRRRDFKLATEYVMKVPDHSYATSDKYIQLADIAYATNKIGDSISYLIKSLQINSANLQVRENLIYLYLMTDDPRLSEEKKEYNYVKSFYNDWQLKDHAI